jgi:catechol 2,3-dioxygenase-like lactoylglutathione lyase family enzyme
MTSMPAVRLRAGWGKSLSGYAFRGLHHVLLAIPPGAEPQARRFYRDILGMTELEKPSALTAKGGCWFRGGALELHLGVEKDFRPARKAHPGLLVEDLDAVAKRLADAGVDVDWDGDFPGFRRFYATDPLGNRLEFLEPETVG